MVLSKLIITFAHRKQTITIMITEYYTEKELVQEIEKACAKFEEMKNGWFGKKLIKVFKVHKQGGTLFQTMTLNKQVYHIEIIWGEKSHKDYGFGYCIKTEYETKKGKLLVSFENGSKNILIHTPHFRKRVKERKTDKYCNINDIISTKYVRNGREYELFNYSEKDVLVTRRGKSEKRIIWLITALTRDMCTNKNYTELLSRLDNHIENFDDYSVFNWR